MTYRSHGRKLGPAMVLMPPVERAARANLSGVALPTEGDASASAGVRTIEIGLVVTPVLDAPTVERLREDLERELAHRYPDVRWKITAVRDALVTAPAGLPEVFEAARAPVLAGTWDLG